MKYSRVRLAAIGYELAPVVVASEELEDRLAPVYRRLHLPAGQLELLTGIAERRWWEPDYPLSLGAATAADRALATGRVTASAVETLIYAGVCRESFEPATACAVAARIGVDSGAAVYDVSNACLGVLNGIVEIANRIELGQIRAGLVVSAETAREIVEVVIARMLADPTHEVYTRGLATLTGGSGAVAVLLTDGSFDGPAAHRLQGGVIECEPRHYRLCRWGLDDAVTLHRTEALPQDMYTDSVAVLKHGVALGARTWERFMREMGHGAGEIDRVICHQVGHIHRDTILETLGLPASKDFSTFRHLGNTGTVSLPMTAALADERGIIRAGDRVAFLGIGSGLNCLMLGWEW